MKAESPTVLLLQQTMMMTMTMIDQKPKLCHHLRVAHGVERAAHTRDARDRGDRR
jgi:hypothetical protein